MELTAAQLDRACGVLLGTAAGDALGAPFEFGPLLGPDVKVDSDDDVSGRSMWETGEWTDDTSMAIAIAEVAATGADLRDETGRGRDRAPVASVGPRARHPGCRHSNPFGVERGRAPGYFGGHRARLRRRSTSGRAGALAMAR